MRVHKNRHPFCLNLESDVSTGIQPNPAADSERETREVEACAMGDVRPPDAEQHEWSCPWAPLFNDVFAAEVSVKLVKYHTLTRNRGADVLGVQIGILPCPTYFDQTIFLKAYTERNSVARGRIDHDSRVCT